MAERTVIIPPGSEKSYERFHFAPAVKVGDTVYCSGVIGGGDDPAEQFASAFESLANVLETAGCTMADIAELTTYHVNMSEHLATFMAARDAVISEPYPAWTAIGVSELAMPNGLVEIQATAVVDSAA